jgi:hypothetical protein
MIITKSSSLRKSLTSQSHNYSNSISVADPDLDLTFQSDADPDPGPTFQFDADPDPVSDSTINLFPDLDLKMLQNDPLRLPPYYFDADPDLDPAFTVTVISYL